MAAAVVTCLPQPPLTDPQLFRFASASFATKTHNCRWATLLLFQPFIRTRFFVIHHRPSGTRFEEQYLNERMNEFLSLCLPPLIETYHKGAAYPSYACLYSSLLSLLQKPVNVRDSGNEFQLEGRSYVIHIAPIDCMELSDRDEQQNGDVDDQL